MSVCKVGGLLAAGSPLAAEDCATLSRALFDGVASAGALSTALRRIGQDVGSTTVKDHRASRCACTRKA